MSCVGVRVGKILNTWFYPKRGSESSEGSEAEGNVIQARKESPQSIKEAQK